MQDSGFIYTAQRKAVSVARELAKTAKSNGLCNYIVTVCVKPVYKHQQTLSYGPAKEWTHFVHTKKEWSHANRAMKATKKRAVKSRS